MTRRTQALTALATALIVPPLALSAAAPAQATPGGTGNCSALDSGTIVVPGNADRTTVEAPAGTLITGYCVKSAGLKGTTGAPEYVTLQTPVSKLSLTHTDGGNLTHYSLALREIPTEPAPTEPAPTEPAPTEPAPTEPAPTEPAPTEPAPADPSFPANPPSSPNGFDWNWTYADPACDAVTVAYPSDIPSGQANDVNIRFSSNVGEFTLNFHNNESTWVGTTGFTYATHRNWPAGVSSYDVTWVQVGGTNYHWQGDVKCVLSADSDPTTLDVPLAVTQVDGFRTGRTTVTRGKAPRADVVHVAQVGSEDLVLQKRAHGSWKNLKTVATSATGDARVVFPRQTRRGTTSYRLAVPGSESVTGATTATYNVRAR
ncbi:hypothetical protein BH09ACT12_BH09ACT12_36500 [soil metagenome]